MKAWILVGGLLMGAAMAVYQMYREREQQQSAHAYGGRGGDDDVENDFVWVPRAQRRPATRPRQGDLCSICQDPLIHYEHNRIKYGIVALPCAHWYHLACAMRLIEYSQPQCPVCRSPFDVSELNSCRDDFDELT